MTPTRYLNIPFASVPWQKAWVVLALLVAVGGCDDDVRNQYQDTSYLFGPTVSRMVIEVDYHQGGEPYTEIEGSSSSPWTLFDLNINKLFSVTPRDIEIPSTLDAMENIGVSPIRDLTVDDLLSLVAEHRNTPDSRDIPSFYVLFANGYFYDDDARQDNVLGLSIGDTSTVVMFKPVIRKTAPDLEGPADDLIRMFAEQMTLIHEFGHAVGLVDNGLTLTSAHHDDEHGKHCTNKKCVMYYLNEGARDLIQFARDLDVCLAQADTPEQAADCRVVFGQECFEDADQAALNQSTNMSD